MTMKVQIGFATVAIVYKSVEMFNGNAFVGNVGKGLAERELEKSYGLAFWYRLNVGSKSSWAFSHASLIHIIPYSLSNDAEAVADYISHIIARRNGGRTWTAGAEAPDCKYPSTCFALIHTNSYAEGTYCLGFSVERSC